MIWSELLIDPPFVVSSPHSFSMAAWDGKEGKEAYLSLYRYLGIVLISIGSH